VFAYTPFPRHKGVAHQQEQPKKQRNSAALSKSLFLSHESDDDPVGNRFLFTANVDRDKKEENTDNSYKLTGSER